MRIPLVFISLTALLVACAPKPTEYDPTVATGKGGGFVQSTPSSAGAAGAVPGGMGGAGVPSPTEEEIYLRGYNESVFEEVGLKPYPNVVVDVGMRANKNSRTADLWHLSALFGTEDSVEQATEFYVAQLSDGKAIPKTADGKVRIEGVTKKQVTLTVKISKGESKTQISIEADFPKNLDQHK